MTMSIPVDLELLRACPLPIPAEGSKDHRGTVIVLGGSRDVPGAVLLAGIAALRAGAGKLQIATVQSRAAALATAVPEAMVLGLAETDAGGISASSLEACREHLLRCNALLVGPGMFGNDEARQLVAAVLDQPERLALVMDAGALDGLYEQGARLKRHSGGIILTPHAGEMANLLGSDRQSVEDNPLAAATRVARDLGAVVVMKGSKTSIVNPKGQSWLYEGGGVGLATSGSGDVLAGVITGLLARGAEPVQACVWGVYLHGEAGARLAKSVGAIGFLASELGPEIPGLMESVAKGRL